MRFIYAFSILFLGYVSACASDNCLRAVRASGFPDRPVTADCSSYFLAIVTPATVTITQTISTTIATVTIHTATLSLPAESFTSVLKKRDVTAVPSNIPTYASACSGSVPYESACSCIGLTRMATTLPTPSVTVTQTASLTSTVISTQTITPFYLQLVNNVVPLEYTISETWLTVLGADGKWIFSATKSEATLFYFKPNVPRTLWAVGFEQPASVPVNQGTRNADDFLTPNFVSPVPLYCFMSNYDPFGIDIVGPRLTCYAYPQDANSYFYQSVIAHDSTGANPYFVICNGYSHGSLLPGHVRASDADLLVVYA